MRYADVKCIDQTRVVLKGRKKGDDYIHANWMTIPDGTKYICTQVCFQYLRRVGKGKSADWRDGGFQGPLNETTVDFWEMIYGEKASVILMLCNYIEGR